MSAEVYKFISMVRGGTMEDRENHFRELVQEAIAHNKVKTPQGRMNLGIVIERLNTGDKEILEEVPRGEVDDVRPLVQRGVPHERRRQWLTPGGNMQDTKGSHG